MLLTTIRPKTTQQAIKWNYFNQEDPMGMFFVKMRHWPDYIVTIALANHLDHRNIFTLFKFFVLNGLSPIIVESIFQTFYSFDEYQLQNMIKRLNAGTFPTDKYFDLIEGRVM